VRIALDAVWIALGPAEAPPARCWIGNCAAEARGGPTGSPPFFETECLVLDVVYVLGILALFVLVAFLGRAVEKL
jgi:uncharacterized membrane protein YhdT